jgi:hypothetical protein
LTNISFEIIKKISTLSSNEARGRKKELNLISWNGRPPKYDIRDWEADHSRMGKGVTLTENELKQLYLCLKDLFSIDNDNQNEMVDNVNVEEEFLKWLNNAPLFLQEIKNVVLYLSEKGYLEDEKRSIFLQDININANDEISNEIQNLSNLYQALYQDFTKFLEGLNEDELELFFILLETRI